MKRSLVNILILLLLPAWAMAQLQEGSGDYQDGILLEQINTQRGNPILLPQSSGNGLSIAFGYREVMDMLRSRVASAETENHLEVTQSGKDNTATVIMEGRGNAMEVTQSGNNNVYEGELKGEDNLIHILQTGHYNKLYQMVEGTGSALQVTQQGSELELIQIETGGNAPAYQVEQRGHGMQIKIEHNQVSFPFGSGN